MSSTIWLDVEEFPLTADQPDPVRSSDLDPALARQAWGGLDLLHIVAYFAQETREAYAALGLHGAAAYLASRSAAMGRVSPAVVTAAFYIFAPSLVATSLSSAWGLTSPQRVLASRYDGVGRALHRLLGDPDVDEAVALARVACDGLSLAGRLSYATHADLPWPKEPLLQLWHAATLLREHRGDGHIATLSHAGLDPVEALITGGITTGDVEFNRTTRGWTDDEWSAGERRLRERGLLDDAGALTMVGTALRRDVEEGTDRAATPGWTHLGAEGTARLRDLVQPLQQTLLAGDLMPAWVIRRI